MTGGANGVKHYTASPPEACKQGQILRSDVTTAGDTGGSARQGCHNTAHPGDLSPSSCPCKVLYLLHSLITFAKLSPICYYYAILLYLHPSHRKHLSTFSNKKIYSSNNSNSSSMADHSSPAQILAFHSALSHGVHNCRIYPPSYLLVTWENF